MVNDSKFYGFVGIVSPTGYVSFMKHGRHMNHGSHMDHGSNMDHGSDMDNWIYKWIMGIICELRNLYLVSSLNSFARLFNLRLFLQNKEVYFAWYKASSCLSNKFHRNI